MISTKERQELIKYIQEILVVRKIINIFTENNNKMKNTIVLVNGVATSGKDTFVNMLSKHIDQDTINVSSVGDIKSFLTDIVDYDENLKFDKDREVLSEIKLLLDKHYNYSENKVKSLQESLVDTTIFYHIREKRNIENLKRYFLDNNIKCVSLYMNREGVKVKNNAGDIDASKITLGLYDIIVDNNGTLEDLENKAELIAKRIYE